MKKDKKLIIKGHDKNPLVKFWNWGWGIYYKNVEFWNYVIVGLLTTVVLSLFPVNSEIWLKLVPSLEYKTLNLVIY